MGTGKTQSVLWAADWLMRQSKEPFRVLIVCPLSVMQRVWADAIFKSFLGRRTVEILHGTEKERLEKLSLKADFSIINFHGVDTGVKTRKKFEIGGFAKALMGRDDIKLVVIDEASAYKDGTTKRHRVAQHVIARRPYLWLLTGTPTPNAPTDAYGLAKLINNAFGKSFKSFRLETMQQVTDFKWVPRRDGYEKAGALLTPSIRFDIKDVWDAPELVTQQRQVDLTAEQDRLMKDLKRDLQMTLKAGQPITAANEVAARTKFLQISLGAIYDAGHQAHAVDARPRLAELEDVLEQAPGKWLVFAPFTAVVDNLHAHFKKKYNCAVVNGAVGQKERSQIFSAFQADSDDFRGIIADPGTMAHGLDLWMGRTAIWYGPTDKAELYAQANKRLHRPGQKFPVSIVQIVSNKLEIEIFRRLENNLSLQGTLLDMAKRGEL
jgi:SNF2 family DNA or RNA helicase